MPSKRRLEAIRHDFPEGPSYLWSALRSRMGRISFGTRKRRVPAWERLWHEAVYIDRLLANGLNLYEDDLELPPTEEEELETALVY